MPKGIYVRTKFRPHKKYLCVDCGNNISHISVRCRPCSSLLRTKTRNVCKCGIVLKWYKSKTCVSCKNYKEIGDKVATALTGKKLSPEHIEKIRKVKTGVRYSLETRKKQSEIQKKIGNIPPHPKGENHPRWKKDRTVLMEKHRIRGSYKWRDWRAAVFERDSFTCQECGKIGGKLEPHHIIPIRSDMNILIFQLTNGITLCRPCHQKTIWKESNFFEKYSLIVAAHK